MLDEAVHNPLQLAQFLAVAPQLGDRVEFIEEQDARRLRREIEKRANILRRTSQKRGNQPVEPRHVEIETQFLRDVSRKAALSCSRSPVDRKSTRLNSSHL